MFRLFNLLLCFGLIVCLGCQTPPVYQSGVLGLSGSRRIIILGEFVEKKEASFYQTVYEGLIWFTPAIGAWSDSAKKIRHSFAQSRASKKLAVELISINYTIGEWEFLVPSKYEKYFLSVLKTMESGAIKRAQGTIFVLEGDPSDRLIKEIDRVFGKDFIVKRY